MIFEACKLQFGSIINLLLRFILHLSALQLMLWLQSYDRLKFCATDRKFGGRIQGQDSIAVAEFDHVIFIYLLSRRALKTFVYLLSRRAPKTFLNNISIINQPSVDACRSVTR